MNADERFERIERKHEELAALVARMERGRDKKFDDLAALVARIGEGHIELEAAQLNQLKAHTRLEQIVADLGERVTNLTILVDTLIKRDMER
jgi:exonuclease VII small subunit